MSPSVARDVNERSKPPRAVFLPFMMGHLFGDPFHSKLQRRVLMEMLSLLETAEESGTIRDLDLSWARARKEEKAIEKALERELNQSSPYGRRSISTGRPIHNAPS